MTLKILILEKSNLWIYAFCYDGVKLSIVSNCPFCFGGVKLSTVLICPWCQIVLGVKLSYHQDFEAEIWRSHRGWICAMILKREQIAQMLKLKSSWDSEAELLSILQSSSLVKTLKLFRIDEKKLWYHNTTKAVTFMIKLYPWVRCVYES